MSPSTPAPTRTCTVLVAVACLLTLGASPSGLGPARGWPQRTLGTIPAPPVLADLDADGLLEVIVGDSQGRIHVWRHDGRRVTPWPGRMTGGDAMFGSPSVGDIDGDGDPEVVVTTRFYAGIDAWHHDGRRVEGFPLSVDQPGVDFIRTPAVLHDLDGDGALEIVVATSSGSVHAINGDDGLELAGWPQQVTSNVQTTPVVGDINADGKGEILVRQWNALFALDADGSFLPGWPVAGSPTHTSPVAGDLDGDGSIEIVEANGFGLRVFDGDGNFLFGGPIPGTFHYSALALGDVDGDGTLEVFGGDSSAGTLYGFHSNLQPLEGWPVSLEDSTVADGSPRIADLDGDGFKEIVFASQGGFLHVWRHDGAPFLDPSPLGESYANATAVGDLDDDGDAEIVVALVEGTVHVLDLDGAWDPDSTDWPFFQGNLHHTGFSANP